jgi:hypothetical protein
MGLVKEICMKCHDEHRKRRWRKMPSKERMWQEGKVACVAFLDRNFKTGWLSVHEMPRQYCYYLVEQTVSQASHEKRQEEIHTL